MLSRRLPPAPAVVTAAACLPAGLLALLLAWLQYRFWFGPGNSGEVMMLEAQVANQERDNEGLQQRNDALAAEVKDLKEGQSAIEERARSELGMIKPDEVYVQVVR